MSLITRTYSFTDGTTAYGSQVESEVANITNTLNNLDAATSTWDIVKAVNATTTPLIADNSTGSNNIFEARLNGVAKVYVDGSGNLQVVGTGVIPTATITTLGHTITNYRRPVLKFINITTIDVENNTGIANQTTILFPDGSTRSVTEDTSSTNKYRRFDITATAQFTSGTEDSGLRSSLTEANNTWYAVYAVKSTINTANFVLSGDTTLPTQANFATLNSNYGTNGWVYLGLFHNGDGANTAADILSFVQAGSTTIFSNVLTGMSVTGAAGTGYLLASTSSATSLAYTYSAGTGAGTVANNISLALYSAAFSAVNVGRLGKPSAALYYAIGGAGQICHIHHWIPASLGAEVTNSTASAIQTDIYIAGWVDGALGTGSNPLL